MSIFTLRRTSSLWATRPTSAPFEEATRTLTLRSKCRHQTQPSQTSAPLSPMLSPFSQPQTQHTFWLALPPLGCPPSPSKPRGSPPVPSSPQPHGLHTTHPLSPPRPHPPSNQPPAPPPQGSPSPKPTPPDPLSFAITQSAPPRKRNLLKSSKDTSMSSPSRSSFLFPSKHLTDIEPKETPHHPRPQNPLPVRHRLHPPHHPQQRHAPAPLDHPSRLRRREQRAEGG